MVRLGSTGELLPVRGFSRRRLDAGPLRSVWVSHDGLRVISGLERANLPGSGEPPLVGQQWLVSISRAPTADGPRCAVSDADLLRVVEDFAMPAYDEDNHHPGIARHLWCPVEEQYRSACECKLSERLVEEPNGYRWTTEEGECRGCQYERRFGLPCTLHHPSRLG